MFLFLPFCFINYAINFNKNIRLPMTIMPNNLVIRDNSKYIIEITEFGDFIYTKPKIVSPSSGNCPFTETREEKETTLINIYSNYKLLILLHQLESPHLSSVTKLLLIQNADLNNKISAPSLLSGDLYKDWNFTI